MKLKRKASSRKGGLRGRKVARKSSTAGRKITRRGARKGTSRVVKRKTPRDINYTIVTSADVGPLEDMTAVKKAKAGIGKRAKGATFTGAMKTRSGYKFTARVKYKKSFPAGVTKSQVLAAYRKANPDATIHVE
jgi:hypothetical protein